MKLAALVHSLSASALLSLTAIVATASCGAPGKPAAPAAAPAAAAPSLVSADAAVALLLGGWVGGGDSPFGEMPFAALFERLPDGSARSWLDDGKGSAIDLHLRRGPDGWRLREQASLPNLGTQAHILQLSTAEAAGDGARLVFTHPERPGFLDIELRIDGEQLVLDARLRGKPHVHFTMKRLPEAALPTLAARLHPPGTAAPTDEGTLPAPSAARSPSAVRAAATSAAH